MKFFSKSITLKTKKSFDFIKIDDAVNKAVRESKIKNGFVLLRSCHVTAALTCVENDQTALQDLEKVLRKLLPNDFPWTHTAEGINNARAHQAVALLGQTHWVPLKDGRIKLGIWQSLFLIELFEPRTREIEIIVVGE